MTHRIFIDGAAGTTGLEIRDRLEGREEFDLIVLDDERRKDVSARREALHEADVAILCLPDDAAREAVKLAEGSDTRIIDASSAHRVADGWTYGFPELVNIFENAGRDAIANAQFVANPGCYPTGYIALLAPLIDRGLSTSKPCRLEDCIDDGLLPFDFPYTVNAVSGFSGGGNTLIDRFESHPDIAYRAYGLRGSHKHLREMQAYTRTKHPPVFSPSVVPAFRGMVVDIPISLKAIGSCGGPGTFLNWLDEMYDNHGVIDVRWATDTSELLLKQDADPWDGMELFVFADPDLSGDNEADHVRLIARLDNLGKGASGAAIQNLNIMCGIEETTGLRL